MKPATHYEVQIVNPATGTPKTWSTHDARVDAEAEAIKVRLIGMFAQVRSIEEPPPCAA